MSTPYDLNSLGPKELGALHAAARRRAQQLRREAIEDFWRGADAAWAVTLSSAQRSAQRLLHRLARHARSRAQPHDAPSTRRDGVCARTKAKAATGSQLLP